MKYKLKNLPTLTDIKKIFFVGIKGVGMSPLAIIARQAGIEVAGSDLEEEFITDKYLAKNNIPIFIGFKEEDIQSFFKDCGVENALVVTTGAHKGFDNPQVKFALSRKIPVLSQGQALAQMMEGEIIDRTVKGVSIAGSHGKTTITALLATTAKAMGLDPSYSIGTGEVEPLGAPGHLGRGEIFIAEADEYASEPIYDRIPKFLYQRPNFAIFNNIDFDHPDMFSDIDEVFDAFEELSYNIKSGGILFINGDDQRLLGLKKNIIKDIRVVTYGKNPSNDYIASKIVTADMGTKFTVHKKGEDLGVFDIALLGEKNAINALSVIAFLTEIGNNPSNIKVCISEFEGSKRRSERIGKTHGGALVFDDYGHHPVEIKTTLSSLKKAYPEKKLVVVFQPHTYSRTKALLEDFAGSFTDAFKVILTPVFKSARDTEQDVISNTEVVDAFQKKCDTSFFENFSGVIEYVSTNFDSEEYLIVTLGAGDVYKIGRQLINS